MKRYGDNLISKDEEESENTHRKPLEVLRGGCGVRYEILDFILSREKPREHKKPNVFTLFRLKEKDKPAH